MADQAQINDLLAADSTVLSTSAAVAPTSALSWFLLIALGIAVTFALVFLIYGATKNVEFFGTATQTATSTSTQTSTGTGTGFVPATVRYTEYNGTGINNDPKSALTSFIGNRTHYPLPANPTAITEVTGTETAGECAQTCLAFQPNCRAYTYFSKTGGCKLWQYANPASFTLDTTQPQGQSDVIVGVLDTAKQVKTDADIALWYDTSDQRMFVQPNDPTVSQKYTYIRDITKLECTELCLRDTSCRALSAQLVKPAQPRKDLLAGPAYKVYSSLDAHKDRYAKDRDSGNQYDKSYNKNNNNWKKEDKRYDSDNNNYKYDCLSGKCDSLYSMRDPFHFDHRQYTSDNNLNWRAGTNIPNTTAASADTSLSINAGATNNNNTYTYHSSNNHNTNKTYGTSSTHKGADKAESLKSGVAPGAEAVAFDEIDGEDIVNCTLWNTSLSQANQPTDPLVFIARKR